MEKLVFQMFILGTGEFLNSALAKGLGGVIFFTRDIETKDQFTKLIQDIKSQSVISPFLSIDQEGGKVERTENLHPRYLSARFAFQKGEQFLAKQTEEIASELKEYGINLNFAPCADVNTNPNNPIIGERSFSDNTDDVIKGVDIVSDIYRKNGIIPCVKHYPGHGDADKDSHLTLPCIDLPMDEMEKFHIRPFKHAVENDIEMIMVAHLYCKCFDKDVIPTSLSENAIGYLRKDLGYNGVIISDDMVMKGVQKYGIVDALVIAIQAGVNMFIFRDADKKTFETIGKLVEIVEKSPVLQSKVVDSVDRIMKLKRKFGLMKNHICE